MAGEKDKGGRPAGGVEGRNRLKDAIEKKIPMEERVDLVSEIARGVVMRSEDGTGVRVVDTKGVEREVFIRPPDLKALEYLEDRVSGKPRAALELPNEDEAWGFLLIPSQIGARKRESE